MSHTNETPNYGLPQYVGTDILNPLVDTNDAYEKIDTALKNIADGVVNSDTRLDALENTVGDVNTGLVKDMSDVQEKIGDTPLTTTAQTLTGAIEEVKAADKAVADRVTVVENALPTKADTTEVVALGTRMTTAEGKISTLETNVAGNTSDISSMQTALRNKAYTHYKRVETLAVVVADGVKTYAELLSQLFTDLQTSITNLADDEFITGSIELVRAGEQNAVASAVLWNKNTSLNDVTLTMHTTAANGIITEVFLVASTGIFRSFKVDVDGAHFYENSANAPSTGVSIALEGVIYKANDPVLS